MKSRYILYIVALVVLLSCEKELDISVLNGKGGALTISAMAVPDSAFNISLTRAYDIDKVPVKVMKTFLLLDVGEYHYGNPSNGGEEWTYNSIMDKFEFDSLGNASQAYREYAIMDAKVSAVVNGKDKYEFIFNDNNCLYESEYIPKEGDNITVYAEGYTDSTRVSYERASSKLAIPKKPKVEILGIEYEYRDFDYEWNGMGHVAITGEVDTVAHIKLKLYDDPSEHNYYRLKVRTYSWYHSFRGCVAFPFFGQPIIRLIG